MAPPFRFKPLVARAEADATIALPASTMAGLDQIARTRGEPVGKLAVALLTIIAAEPTLAANVLDDGA